MAVEVVMPRMGLTMEEGTLVSWSKHEGDAVKKGEILFEIETDKTTVEIEAPADGILREVQAQPGDTIPVGTTIAFLAAKGEEIPPRSTPPAPQPTPAVTAHQPDNKNIKILEGGDPRGVKASPAARRIAKERGVNLMHIQGSGPAGRILVRDVEQIPPPVAGIKASPLALRIAQQESVDLAAVKGSGPGGRIQKSDLERVIAARTSAGEFLPQSNIEKLVAERMVESFTSAPHFYLQTEVDARQLVAMRKNLAKRFASETEVRITFTDLLVKFTALTLAKHPRMVFQWTEAGLRQIQDIHVGIAVDTPNGLIVPVIHNADQREIVDIAERRSDLAQRARSGGLRPEELELGSFTITNLGMFPIDSFLAIINPPQAAILSIGRIRERALPEEGRIIAAPMINLTLSIDHRALDGAAGARFLGDLAESIETPGLLLQ